jgi:hypothetical protein
MESYLRELDVNQAAEVLFVADGAKWIWRRVTQLRERLGLTGVPWRELVDFYHVVKHVYALAALNNAWQARERKRWATRQRRRLRRGELKAFVEEVERVCRGKDGPGWSRERDYLLQNARAGRLDYAEACRAKMPISSGTMESAIRRVVNLRLKGAGIFWQEEHAEQMLLLRTYYKSNHWQVLTNKALAIPLEPPSDSYETAMLPFPLASVGSGRQVAAPDRPTGPAEGGGIQVRYFQVEGTRR